MSRQTRRAYLLLLQLQSRQAASFRHVRLLTDPGSAPVYLLVSCRNTARRLIQDFSALLHERRPALLLETIAKSPIYSPSFLSLPFFLGE